MEKQARFIEFIITQLLYAKVAAITGLLGIAFVKWLGQ